jgi:hypothetical protein
MSESAKNLSHFTFFEQIELCEQLFKNRVQEEEFRLRSFGVCDKLKPYGSRLAKMGYMYTGKEVNSRLITGTQTRVFNSYLFIMCVFCKFEHRVIATLCDTGFNFDELKTLHDQNRTNGFQCRTQANNIPIRDSLTPNNFHVLDTPINRSPDMSRIDVNPVLTSAEQNDPINRWVSCLVCRQRNVNVAFLPCGCAMLCSSCLQTYKCQTCPKCLKMFEGYAKIIIT